MSSVHYGLNYLIIRVAIMTGATSNISTGGSGQNQPSLLERMPAFPSNPGTQQGLDQNSSPPSVVLGLGPSPSAPLAALVPQAIDLSSTSGSSANSLSAPSFVPEIPSYHHLGH